MSRSNHRLTLLDLALLVLGAALALIVCPRDWESPWNSFPPNPNLKLLLEFIQTATSDTARYVNALGVVVLPALLVDLVRRDRGIRGVEFIPIVLAASAISAYVLGGHWITNLESWFTFRPGWGEPGPRFTYLSAEVQLLCTALLMSLILFRQRLSVGWRSTLLALGIFFLYPWPLGPLSRLFQASSWGEWSTALRNPVLAMHREHPTWWSSLASRSLFLLSIAPDIVLQQIRYTVGMTLGACLLLRLWRGRPWSWLERASVGLGLPAAMLQLVRGASALGESAVESYMFGLFPFVLLELFAQYLLAAVVALVIVLGIAPRVQTWLTSPNEQGPPASG